jgi:hypothetical protein
MDVLWMYMSISASNLSSDIVLLNLFFKYFMLENDLSTPAERTKRVAATLYTMKTSLKPF